MRPRSLGSLQDRGVLAPPRTLRLPPLTLCRRTNLEAPGRTRRTTGGRELGSGANDPQSLVGDSNRWRRCWWCASRPALSVCPWFIGVLTLCEGVVGLAIILIIIAITLIKKKPHLAAKVRLHLDATPNLHSSACAVSSSAEAPPAASVLSGISIFKSLPYGGLLHKCKLITLLYQSASIYSSPKRTATLQPAHSH